MVGHMGPINRSPIPEAGRLAAWTLQGRQGHGTTYIQTTIATGVVCQQCVPQKQAPPCHCYIMVFATLLYKAYYLVGSLYYNYYFSYLPISCL
jgi:hypothetical protein